MSVKVLYTTHAVATGGRKGHTRSADGIVDVDLSIPKAMGGPGRAGATTPEDLFAAGYAACFCSAVEFVARQSGVRLRAGREYRGDGRWAPAGRGREAGGRGAPGLPVFERDPRQPRRRPRGVGGLSDLSAVAPGGELTSSSRSPRRRRTCRRYPRTWTPPAASPAQRASRAAQHRRSAAGRAAPRAS